MTTDVESALARARQEHREVRLVVRERQLYPGSLATVFWYGTVAGLVGDELHFHERGDGRSAHVVSLADVVRVDVLDVAPTTRRRAST